MSGFFDSEQVRESLFELDDLQEKLFNQLYDLPSSTKEKKKEHLDTMREFLEKQKLFIFRMTLSDDPEAVKMKQKIIESAKLFGFEPGDSLPSFFERLGESIDKLEKSLDD
jgi:hypothetical protein